ncbi:MAG: hypothetical protein ACRD18_03100, partial [Terriglobia bacterium]
AMCAPPGLFVCLLVGHYIRTYGDGRSPDKDSAMYIQYTGFDVATRCRIYHFRVLNNLVAERDFAIRVGTEAFCEAALKLQEGPDICFGRLKQELETETEGSRANAELSIGEGDIREYREQHHARTLMEGKRRRRIGFGPGDGLPGEPVLSS